MRTKERFLKAVTIALILIFGHSCASRQDQFGHAVRTNDVALAKSTVAPKFARMEVQESNGKWSTPIQYAIINRSPEMATFLLKNDCHKQMDNQNLTYYAASNGYNSMARFFASKGYGSVSDITKAKRDRANANRRAMAGAFIGLGLLAMMMASSAGSGGGNQGMSDAEVAGMLHPSRGGVNPQGYR